MSGDQSEPALTFAQANAWDAMADERERLADERERLADGREHLADERERLADEQERRLDERYGASAPGHNGGSAADAEVARNEAEESLARAEARVQRALAERDRAHALLARSHDSAARHEAGTDRDTAILATRDLAGGEAQWALERGSFVASERERLADVRDQLQDLRDDLADGRERAADARDADDRRREDRANEHDANAIRAVASIAHARTSRARVDLAQIRDSAHRQRQAAARQRETARRERGDARARGGAFAPSAYGPLLAAEFTALTRELFASQDLCAIAQQVLGFGVESIPGCVACSVAVLQGTEPVIHITTDAVALQLDAIQMETGEGPVAQALESPEPVHVACLDQASQWPLLANAATALGISGMVAYGLAVPRDGRWRSMGTLALYAEEPDAFDGEDRELGGILACYVSVAAGLERDRTDLSRRQAALHRALGTRDVIGQAKGILMERRHLSAGDAFDVLRQTSQRLNVRVHDLAAQLAESGDLPG